MNKDKVIVILLLAIIAGVVGYKLVLNDTGDTDDSASSRRISVERDRENIRNIYPTKAIPGIENQENKFVLKDIPLKSVVLKGERMLHFNSKEEMEEFLKKARAKGLKIVRSIPALNMVRIRFTKRIDSNEFLAHFGEVSLISENSPVQVPDPILNSRVGFRSDPLEYLGIKNNKDWGKGVIVAVIDSGVVSHSSLKGKITHFDVLNDGSEITSHHGTSVASLIAADSTLIKGVAPGTEILDIRALRNDGSGDAFAVAEAIVLAVENGAQVLNLSLGAKYDNPALREAVLYAQGQGVIIVAAVGNEGAGQVSYPASYPGVIGVGSSDANEGYLSFSNRGPEVDISAPGIELIAAGASEDVILFTGTSASAPLVAATLAYQISQYPDLTNEQIISQLVDGANDSGPPGEDSLFGDGILNVGRIETNNNQANYDLAAAGFHLEPIAGTDNMKLFFSGENRGTETVGQIEMTLSYPDFKKTYIFKDIESSQTFFETIIINSNSKLIQEGQQINLTVKQIGGENDLSNNSKAVKINLNNQK